MELPVKEITNLPGFKYKYSVCTLVTDHKEYRQMVMSFLNSGFSEENTEFLYIDNSHSNKFDAFSGLNMLLNNARGEFIILCHQDIELIKDNEAVLNQKVCEIEALDKNWAVLGNAGGLHLKKTFELVTYPDKTVVKGPFPYKVNSLDENFLLLNGKVRISFSKDLNGFHFYGTDIVSIANVLGYSAYVIAFDLLHKSSGNMNKSFYEAKDRFIAKYGRALSSKYVRTTCTSLYLGGNPGKAKVLSKSFFIFWAKIPLKVKKLIKGNYLFNP
ncbi:MAG: hypothetical protein ACK40G_06510 [Cytophagaceae bacterium]